MPQPLRLLRQPDLINLLQQFHKSTPPSWRTITRCSSSRCFTTTSGQLQQSHSRAPQASVAANGATFFLSNRIFDRLNCLEPLTSTSGTLRASSTTTSTTIADQTSATADPDSITSANPSGLLPHRRRQNTRRQSSSTPSSPSQDVQQPLPPDASSVFTTIATSHPQYSFRRVLSTCLSLSKPRLTILVVLTAMAPYALYPVPEMLAPTMTDTPSLSPLTLTFLTLGTTLCSASANALNMIYEPATDAKMSRTRNRPLVRKLISTRAAVLFAILAGATGVGALYFGVNPTVSFLGFSNIVLYAGVYTPLKALTPFNTWIGAVVGGIPPLMGWAAAAGETATRDGSWRELLFANDGSSIGGWIMASLLFAWQFPHFMALSWPIREEYKAAGLRMLAWTNPARNARVALRYSLVFIPLSISLCAANVTEWSFAAISLPINLWLAQAAVRFWKHEGHKGSARGLFWASVWHLPGVLIMALLCKKGMWSRAWKSVFGEAGVGAGTSDGEWEEDLELEEMASMTAARISQKKADVTR